MAFWGACFGLGTVIVALRLYRRSPYIRHEGQGIASLRAKSGAGATNGSSGHTLSAAASLRFAQ